MNFWYQYFIRKFSRKTDKETIFWWHNMTDKHFLQLIKPLDLQHDTKLRLALLKLYFHCFTTLIFYMRSQNSLIAVFPSEIFWQLCVCELKKIWIRMGRWMSQRILGLQSKRHSGQKKMMTEQHVQRKKVVARPLTYTFMAQPLGKLESSFHYMKETNKSSVLASTS